MQSSGVVLSVGRDLSCCTRCEASTVTSTRVELPTNPDIVGARILIKNAHICATLLQYWCILSSVAPLPCQPELRQEVRAVCLSSTLFASQSASQWIMNVAFIAKIYDCASTYHMRTPKSISIISLSGARACQASLGVDVYLNRFMVSCRNFGRPSTRGRAF